MFIVELIKQILLDVKRRKLRTFLAIFSIMWGTISVILLLALGQGFYLKHSQNLASLSNGALFVHIGITSQAFRGQPVGRLLHLKMEDALKIPQALAHINLFSPMIMESASVTFKDHEANPYIVGSFPAYAAVHNIPLNAGSRFINQLDFQQHARVAFVGNQVRHLLNLPDDFLGKTIEINGIPFTVIGWPYVDPENPDSYDMYDFQINIPYTTAMDLWGDMDVSSIEIVTDHRIDAEIFQNQLQRFFAALLEFDPHDSTALYLFDETKIFLLIAWILNAVRIFLAFCGLMTLAVGGVGVANIMFLIVRERTNEIGLRMAIGARYWHVMVQILLEALLIVLAGGLIGIIFALIILSALPYWGVPSWLGTPQLSVNLFLLIMLILIAVGLLAGYFPARRAAEMKPIEALAF